MRLLVVKADYSDPKHKADIPYLLSHYAQDPMGGGQDISDHIKNRLVDELAQRPTAFSILAYVDDQPAGLANCFESFSTFKCQPLINIHDLVVIGSFRGLGISQKILRAIESIAKERDCCKITLEVLSNNEVAKAAYQRFGFESYKLDPNAGGALFWQKNL